MDVGKVVKRVKARIIVSRNLLFIFTLPLSKSLAISYAKKKKKPTPSSLDTALN
jgi:hypothetical protein